MNDSVQPYSADQPWRDEAPAPHTPLPAIDRAAFSAELDALHARLKAGLGEDDINHLRKMERWGRLCTLLGYATAWFPNPIAALLIAVGNVARWAIVSHHVIHKGYDQVPGVPARYRSTVYAQGWRRWLDWADWLYPPAWAYEHNRLHHYHTGQLEDPDLVERGAWVTRLRAVPRPFKWLLAAFLICTWKLVYYAPNTFWAWKQHDYIRARATTPQARAALPTAANVWRIVAPGERLLLPVTSRGLQFYARCVLPYAFWRFALLPALFLPLGVEAATWVLLNSVMAEVLANAHSFLIIAPNHAGDDLHRFDGGCRSRSEFQLQQILGSVNYPGGSDLRDFLQGYLNYQIEHHLWPELPALKYRQAAPEVRRICAKYGVPYVEESVFVRFRKLLAIMYGDARMRRTDMALSRAAPAAPAPRSAPHPAVPSPAVPPAAALHPGSGAGCG